MSEIIVGDKPCEFTDIVIIIGRCSSSLESEDILGLMTFLKTPHTKKAEFRRKYLSDQLSLRDMLAAALSEWRLRCSNDATLTTLIALLRECCLNSYADALEEKYYPEAHMKRLQSHSSQTTDALRSTDHRQHIETTKLLPSSPNSVSTDTNKNRISNEPFAQKCYTCIIMSLAYIFLIGFVIALAFPAVGYLQEKFKESSGEEDKSKEIVSLQLEQKINKTTNYSAVLTPGHLVTSHCMQLSVNGYTDYEDKLLDIEKFESLCVYIHANASKQWNQIDSVVNSSQVKEITFIGCIPFEWLAKIFARFVYIEKLTFVEVEEANFKCQYDLVYFSHSKQETIIKASLNNLVYVEFHNITTWFNIFHFFIQNVAMFRISTMKIVNVIASNPVVQTVRELLKLVRYSLETLHFSGVEWGTSPFSNFNYIFPKLGELRYDFISRSRNLIERINVTAPNLKRLISLEGYLSFDENTVILGMKNIEYLQYGLLVPAHLKEFDVAIYATTLPYLKYLELYILLENPKCNIMGGNNVQQSINLTLHSYYLD